MDEWIMASRILALPKTGDSFSPNGISGCSLPQRGVQSIPNAPPAAVPSVPMEPPACHTFLAVVAHVNDVPIHIQDLPAHAPSCQQPAADSKHSL